MLLEALNAIITLEPYSGKKCIHQQFANGLAVRDVQLQYVNVRLYGVHPDTLKRLK